MSKKIVVDPVTRIEGHLRIEAVVDNGKIVDAWSSSTMWRGIENILKGRDPREAWYWTQRFCGVCTTVHSIASIRAVEDAIDVTVPLNAELIRNIIMGIQSVQDHVIHFYHLHALDWVNIVGALSADPKKTSDLASAIGNKYGKILGVAPYAKNSADYFATVQKRVGEFVNKGRLGLFAPGEIWSHPAYKLPNEANLMAVAHYLEALDWQKEIIKIHAILGSKNPHPQSFLVGGMSIPVDPNSQNAINADKIAHIKQLLKQAADFVKQIYIPDLLAIAPFYVKEGWAGIGGGQGEFDFLSFGDFPTEAGQKRENFWLKPGLVSLKDGDIKLLPVNPDDISEFVTHSWYNYDGGDDKGLHPFDGETTENYTGPKPPYKELNTGENDKYSWVKAPRYAGRPAEVGPLARMLVGYLQGQSEIKGLVDLVLSDLSASTGIKVGVPHLFSTLGRTAARGIETLIMVDKTSEWVDMLVANIKAGDLRVHAGEKWDPSDWPSKCKGVGFHEAPRGMLSHWINIEDGKIANYQAVVPSTWNASPRDATGQRGPYEAALIGTPIADENQPLEILRTIHSYDPCLACAVHVLDTEGNEITRVKVL